MLPVHNSPPTRSVSSVLDPVAVRDLQALGLPINNADFPVPDNFNRDLSNPNFSQDSLDALDSPSTYSHDTLNAHLASWNQSSDQVPSLGSLLKPPSTFQLGSSVFHPSYSSELFPSKSLQAFVNVLDPSAREAEQKAPAAASNRLDGSQTSLLKPAAQTERLAKNRASAQKTRARKRMEAGELSEQLDDLTKQNRGLQQQNKHLLGLLMQREDEIKRLKTTA